MHTDSSSFDWWSHNEFQSCTAHVRDSFELWNAVYPQDVVGGWLENGLPPGDALFDFCCPSMHVRHYNKLCWGPHDADDVIMRYREVKTAKGDSTFANPMKLLEEFRILLASDANTSRIRRSSKYFTCCYPNLRRFLEVQDPSALLHSKLRRKIYHDAEAWRLSRDECETCSWALADLCQVSFPSRTVHYRGSCQEHWKFAGFDVALWAVLSNDPKLHQELQGLSFLIGLNESLPLFRYPGEPCEDVCHLRTLPTLPVLGFSKAPGRPGILIGHQFEDAWDLLKIAAQVNDEASAFQSHSHSVFDGSDDRKICWRGQLSRGIDIVRYANHSQPLLDRWNWQKHPRSRLVLLSEQVPDILDAKFTAIVNLAQDEPWLMDHLTKQGLMDGRKPFSLFMQECFAMAIVEGPTWASNLISAFALDLVPLRMRGYEDVDVWINDAMELGTHFMVADIDAEGMRRALQNAAHGGARVAQESNNFAFSHLSLENQLLHLWLVLKKLQGLSDSGIKE